MRQRGWVETAVNGTLKERLEKELHISPLLARLLILRGVSDPALAKKFLNPSLSDLTDPFLLEGMERAVDRILEGLARKERILVWGDEDCDGITATAVVLDTLADLGSLASSYIPSRVEEGIGLSHKGLERAKADGVGLVITVDCGTSSQKEVDYSKQLGIDIVITDHHEPLRVLPQAAAVVNPRTESASPRELAGVGVAWKLAQAISMKRLGLSPIQYASAKKGLLPLVLFGTVADRVPLRDENRTFVKFGLLEFSKSSRAGLKVLRESSKFDFEAELGVEELMRAIVPLLSGGEREEGKDRALKLLLSQDQEEAEEIASSLARASEAWLARAREAYARVLRKASPASAGVMVVVDSCLSPNLLSYCASRLKEQFGRPAVVIGSRGGVAAGEGRAPRGFDLLEAFRESEDLLLDYGGHKPACGFSMEFSKVREFIERMRRMGEKEELSEASSLRIDANLPLSDITPLLFQELLLLAPFGELNPIPLFLAKGVKMERVTGGYRVSDQNLFLRCKYCEAQWVDLSGRPIELDVVYELDKKGGIFLRDARPSEFNQ